MDGWVGVEGGGGVVFLDAACHHRTAATGARAPERTHTTHQLLRSHFSMFMNISHAFNSVGVCDY